MPEHFDEPSAPTSPPPPLADSISALLASSNYEARAVRETRVDSSPQTPNLYELVERTTSPEPQVWWLKQTHERWEADSELIVARLAAAAGRRPAQRVVRPVPHEAKWILSEGAGRLPGVRAWLGEAEHLWGGYESWPDDRLSWVIGELHQPLDVVRAALDDFLVANFDRNSGNYGFARLSRGLASTGPGIGEGETADLGLVLLDHAGCLEPYGNEFRDLTACFDVNVGLEYGSGDIADLADWAGHANALERLGVPHERLGTVCDQLRSRVGQLLAQRSRNLAMLRERPGRTAAERAASAAFWNLH